MDDLATRISGDEIATLGLDDWRAMLSSLESRFHTGDFTTGLAFVARVGAAAVAAEHHPDLDLRPAHVDVRLTTRDVGTRTPRDVDLARAISAIADELGIVAHPATVSRVEVGLDTWDAEEVKPFWKAVLGLVEDPLFPDDLRDPHGDNPTIWFQETTAHDTPRQRFHFDVWVPLEVAATRIQAALAAGGTMVSDQDAPTFTVLADPQGNKACVCTHVARDN